MNRNNDQIALSMQSTSGSFGVFLESDMPGIWYWYEMTELPLLANEQGHFSELLLGDLTPC